MGLGYRQVKGVLLAIERKESRLKVADYSTINRRFNKLDTRIRLWRRNTNEYLWIAVDASGVSVTNRGEWMRKIHRKGKITECKGFLKIHVAVDVKTKEAVAIEITREDIGDNSKFNDVIEGSIINTGRALAGVYADGGYDTYNNFDKLEDAGIQPIIRIDGNAITAPPPDNYIQRRRGEPVRRKHAREQLKDRDKWKKEKKYGLRWFSETFFSVFKRCYGTHTMARKEENMQQELVFKTHLYNQMLNIT